MSKKILKDISRNGKERPWRERKLENLQYAEYLRILNFKKANRVKECGEVLRFVVDDEGRLRLYQTWFCKSRLCPLCNWRRSMGQSNQLMQILDEAHKQRKRVAFVFNSDGRKCFRKFKAGNQEMGRAVYKLFQYKSRQKFVGLCTFNRKLLSIKMDLSSAHARAAFR